jgi:hypothetical protein
MGVDEALADIPSDLSVVVKAPARVPVQAAGDGRRRRFPPPKPVAAIPQVDLARITTAGRP